MDDATLLSRYARHRDVEAFAEILNRHSGLVYGTCLRVLGDRHRAEDAAQDCFLALAEHAGSIRHSLAAWLHRVALHAALKLRRRQQPASEVDVATLPAPLASAWRVIAPQLDTALEALPEDLREIITRRYLAGRTQAEIGQDLGVSQATVSRRLEQGVVLLRRHLARQLDDHTVEMAMGLALVPAPASLVAACGRIGLAGVGGPSGGAAGGLSVAAKVAVVAILIGGGSTMAMAWAGRAHTPVPPTPSPIATAAAALSENPPEPAPAPVTAGGAALCAQLVTINVRGWPVECVIDTLSDQLQLDHARLEIMPCADDQTLVDVSADQQPLGAVLDQVVHESAWRVQVGSQAVVLYHPAPVLIALQTRASPIQRLLAAPAPARAALAEHVVGHGDLREIAELLAGLAAPDLDRLAASDPAQAFALQLEVLHALSQAGASWQSWLPRGNPLANLRDDAPARQGVIASWRRCRAHQQAITPFQIYLAGELGITELGDELLQVVADPAAALPGIDHHQGVMHLLLETIEREWALRALGRMRYASALPVLRGLLTAQPLDAARLSTLGAVGECGTPDDAALVLAVPLGGVWIVGTTAYTAMARLAPASLPDLLKRGGTMRWGEGDAFITYPCSATLPRVLAGMGTDGWWMRWAGWKGTGRLPAAEVDAAIRAKLPTGGHGAGLDTILARDGDDAALDRVVLAVARQPEVLGDRPSRSIEDIALQLMARLPAARQQRALAELRAHLDLAHAGDAALSMLRVQSTPALAAELIAAWSSADDQSRPALLRALAQLRQQPARTFIEDHLRGSPSRACAEALEIEDLGDPLLRKELASLLGSDPAMGLDAICAGLSCFNDTLVDVQSYVTLHAGSFNQPAVGRMLGNLPLLDDSPGPGLIDVLLAVLANSADAGERHDIMDALTDGCARRCGMERIRVVVAISKALHDANPAVASFAASRRNQLCAANPGSDQGEDLYGERAVMEGGLDDLTAASQFDALVALGVPAPTPGAPAAPPPAAPPSKDF